MEKNILIALDDSDNAMAAVESLAENFTPDHKVTLFSVVQDTAAVCEMYSPELSPHFMAERRDFCSLDHIKKDHQVQHHFLNKCLGSRDHSTNQFRSS